MRKTFSLAGLGVLLGTLAAPALAIPQSPTFQLPGMSVAGPPAPYNARLTARAVSGGAVRSNTLLPLGGSEIIDNPVPRDLKNESGWSRDELQAALQKQHDVDVTAVANYLYSPAGVAFLSEGVGGNNYTPYRSQANQVQAVRSAIIADAADGQLSGYGMMANLPTDQRLQGPMKACISSGNSAQETSLMSWYATTPTCIQQRTAQAAPEVTNPGAPPSGAVRGLW
ncbi:alpha/beta hydrolase [Synechococcus sp. FGCU-3]|nr:alpha/beta hydrolase [Synechococcus sp. FGCU3]